MKRLLVAAGLITGTAIGGSQLVDNGSFCPDGWTSHAPRDEHAVVYSCEQGDWLVVLNPDKTFDYAIGVNQITEDPSQVPGWSE